MKLWQKASLVCAAVLILVVGGVFHRNASVRPVRYFGHLPGTNPGKATGFDRILLGDDQLLSA